MRHAHTTVPPLVTRTTASSRSDVRDKIAASRAIQGATRDMIMAMERAGLSPDAPPTP